MTDFFAVLGVPRRPFPDPAELKSRWVQLCGELHPDRIQASGDAVQRADANTQSAKANEAYRVLSHDAPRLGHLLELELGKKPSDLLQMPEPMMELFVEVGQLNRKADGLIAEKQAAVSPLLKAQCMGHSLDLLDTIQTLQSRVHDEIARMTEAGRALNAAWGSAPDSGNPDRLAQLPIHELEEAWRRFGFLTRWHEQLSSRAASLAF